MSRPYGIRHDSPDYLCPRRHVPRELKRAKVGNIDSEGSQALAALIRKRLMAARGYREPSATVLCDIDGAVFACLRNGTTLAALLATHPYLLVGVYTARCDLADIAADLDTFRRAA